MTTPPLSPAAQSVSDAAYDAWVTEDHASSIAAAALTAAADQEKLRPEHWEGTQPDDYERGWNAALHRISSIATELRQEGQA